MNTVGAVRKRIHVTETPRLAAILDRHGVPGEPRAATLVRLAERADALADADQDFLVFDAPGPLITTDQVAAILESDLDDLATMSHG